MPRPSILPTVVDLEEIERANAPTIRPSAPQSGTMRKVDGKSAAALDDGDDLSEDEIFAIWQSYLQ